MALRLATVGTSSITEVFIQGLALVEEVCLAAVYSRDAGKARAFAEKHGAPLAFSSLTELARSSAVDAVYVASPNSLHFQQSMLFLQSGKHVLCEKTATICREDARALFDAARGRGVVFMEAIFPLHLPQMKALETALGEIGPVSVAKFSYEQYSSRYPAYLGGEMPNIFNPMYCAGALMDLGVYCVYPALHLFGLPQKIQCGASFLKTGADCSGAAVFSYEDKQVVLSYSKTGQSFGVSEIVGENGSILMDSVARLQHLRMVRRDGSVMLLGEPDEEKHVQMSYQLRAFCGFTEEPRRAEDRLCYLSHLCCDVSGTLREMRRQAGICFPDDLLG